MVQTTRLQLSGLTCGACEKVIGNRIKKIEGVEEVHVSPVNGFASIISPRKIEIQEVETVLQGTHYKVINNL